VLCTGAPSSEVSALAHRTVPATIECHVIKPRGYKFSAMASIEAKAPQSFVNAVHVATPNHAIIHISHSIEVVAYTQ
jgi:hypothetical protein